MILLWLGIEPKTRADAERLGLGLQALLAEMPALAVRTDSDGTTRVGAESEAQLDAVIERLVHAFGVEAAVTGIDVAYKEALTRAASGEAKYAAQVGGRGRYAHVKIGVEPGEPGSGFVFDNAIAGGAIPGEFIKPIAEGLREARARGVLAGYPIDDVHVTLEDGSYHEVDSSAMAFKIAAALAFMDAAKKAQPMLLEPIMHVFLQVPEEYAARAAAILTARRGVLNPGSPQPGDWPTIGARLPLSDAFGLASEVRDKTGGRGICHIRFAHYQPAAHADDDGDRDTPVREPKRPGTPPHVLRAAVPEPIGDTWTAWDDDQTLRPRRA